MNPTLDPHTLFDNQLRSASYSATDFCEIGYTVAQMSSTRFYRPALTMAFFTAEELIQAGFNAEEVRSAFEHLECDAWG